MRLIDADEIRIKPKYMHDICGSVMIRVEDIARIINDMPIIELQKWIPCSERLPKYGQLVLTYNLKDDEYELNHIIDEEDGEWFIHGVHAWMPLPEPWKGEEE